MRTAYNHKGEVFLTGGNPDFPSAYRIDEEGRLHDPGHRYDGRKVEGVFGIRAQDWPKTLDLCGSTNHVALWSHLFKVAEMPTKGMQLVVVLDADKQTGTCGIAASTIQSAPKDYALKSLNSLRKTGSQKGDKQ
jgi:hypothetical protein